jgi:sporulation protein YlmC with PRC-barrel domain
MFMKSITAGLLGTVLLATTALGQTPGSSSGTSDSSTSATSSSSSTHSAASSSSYQGTWRAGKLAGVNVYNDKNESLGDINDVLIDKSGKAVAVVIGVGGFLGVGERYVAIPFEKVRFVTEPMQNTATNTGTGNRPAGTAAPATTTTTGAATGATAPSGGATSSTAANSTNRNPWYPDHAIISGASKDELKNMPEFKYNS